MDSYIPISGFHKVLLENAWPTKIGTRRKAANPGGSSYVCLNPKKIKLYTMWLNVKKEFYQIFLCTILTLTLISAFLSGIEVIISF